MPSPDPSLEKPRTNPLPESLENSQSFLKAAKMAQTKDFFEFGPYRLYRAPTLLLRGEAIVALTPKVLETLKVLVQSAGQPVSKEELLRAVWPDTFVEESNLAQNVSVLRKALGTRPDGSGYIDTIPKRGYRFAGEVKEEVEAPEVSGTAPTPEPSQPVAPSRAKHIKPGKLVVAAAITLTAFGAFAIWRTVHHVPTPAFDSLAVLPFRNLSGDSQQDYISDGLTEALIGEVSKIGGLRVISQTSVMRYKENKKPLPEICQELKVGAVIEGSIARFGDQVRVSVSAARRRERSALMGRDVRARFRRDPKAMD